MRRGTDPSWKQAVFTLGQMYEHGHGVAKDEARAFRHYAAVGALTGAASDFPPAAVEACRLSENLEQLHQFCQPLGLNRYKDVPGATAGYQRFTNALDVEDLSVAFYRAAYVRDRERFERALLAGADPNAVYAAQEPETVLWHLVRTARSPDDLDLIRTLLTHGADPNGGLSSESSMIGRMPKRLVQTSEGPFRTADIIPVLLRYGYRVTGFDLSSVRRDVAHSEQRLTHSQRPIDRLHYNMLREQADPIAFVTHYMHIQRDESNRYRTVDELLMLHSGFRQEYGINALAIQARRFSVDDFDVVWSNGNFVDVKTYDYRCLRDKHCAGTGEEVLRFRVEEDAGRLALYPWGAFVDQGRSNVPFHSRRIRGPYEAPTTPCRARPGTSQEIEAFVHDFMTGTINREGLNWEESREEYKQHVLPHVSPTFLSELDVNQELLINRYWMDEYTIFKQQGDLVDVGFINKTCLEAGNCSPHEQSTLRLRLVREDGRLYLLPSRIDYQTGYLNYWWQSAHGFYDESLNLCEDG